MQNQPLVSVVITTHGRSSFLRAALNSVVSQTYNNIEVIVVDDNSESQNIRSEVRNIISEYPQVRLIENGSNLGGSLSRNEGIKNANGLLISFLDDDDTYLPERIEECVIKYKECGNKGIGLIYTFCQSVTIDGCIIAYYMRRPFENVLYQHLYTGCLCATSQWVIPASVFKEVGLFEQTPCKQDSIMLLKILGAGYKVLCVEKVLSNYTIHNTGTISGNPTRNIKGLLNYQSWARKYYDKLSEYQINKIEQKFAYDFFYNYSLCGERKQAWNALTLISRNISFTEYIKSLLLILFGQKYLILRMTKQRVLRAICKSSESKITTIE